MAVDVISRWGHVTDFQQLSKGGHPLIGERQGDERLPGEESFALDGDAERIHKACAISVRLKSSPVNSSGMPATDATAYDMQSPKFNAAG